MKTEINIQKELGGRIRERRKKQGLTQAQLCGDYMTRNMLSRIETGDATPSLDTLLFISKKLKAPPAYFLCRDSKEEAEYSKIVRIKEARRALGTEQYKKCTDICQDLPSDDDEVSFLIVNSCIMTAIELFDKGMLREALDKLDSAATALHSTVYLYKEMHSQIKLLQALIASLSKGELPSTQSMGDSSPLFFTKDRVMYLTALSMEKENSGAAYALAAAITPDSPYFCHLKAKALLSDGDGEGASELLKKALDGSPDAFCTYFVTLDLEGAYRLSEDYKSAYEYASARMALHEKYSSI